MYSAHASSVNRNSCPGYVYKVGWTDASAGYTGTSIDITDTMLHYALLNPEIQQAFPTIFQVVKDKYDLMLQKRYKDQAHIQHVKLTRLYN
jgi:phenolic acid decarboxylase